MTWFGTQTGVTPQGKIDDFSPKTFEYPLNQTQFQAIAGQGQGECSDFLSSLEQAFPEEPFLSSDALSKDIPERRDFRKKMARVPSFYEPITKTQYQINLQSCKFLDFKKSSHLPSTLKRSSGKILNVAKRFIFNKGKLEHRVNKRRTDIKLKKIRK